MIRVRRTSEHDLAAVIAIEGATDTAEWVGEKGEQWHRSALADPEQEHLVVEDGNGTVIGFGVLAGLSESVAAPHPVAAGRGDGTDGVDSTASDLAGPTIEIRRLALAAGQRGSGRGRALVRALLKRAYNEHRAERVWLDLRIDNERARLLYESEGFWPERVVPEGLPGVDGTAYDLLIMAHEGGYRSHS